MLGDRDTLVIDCQSTGATPAQGHLLEIGWTSWRPRDEPPPIARVSARLVALPEEARLPPVVSRLTGIRRRDLSGAPGPADTYRRLAAELDGGPVATVIHFAQFEERFLRDLHARFGQGGYPFEVRCSHRIARKLLPDLPRCSLRAVAGYFGFAVELPRRAAWHVAATCVAWRGLVGMLAERGVHTGEELDRWLALTPSRRSGRRIYPMPRAVRLALPDAPGIYRMKGTGGAVLYVGKATSLKRRVNSYFQKQRRVPERLLEMLSQARDLEVTATATALEAALLEADEIKRLAPPYNHALLAGERDAWFASRDLSSTRPEPDERHVVGPLPSRWSVAPIDALGRLLGGEGPPCELLARVLGVADRWAPDEACGQAGLASFCRRFPLAGGSVAELLRLGDAVHAWRLLFPVERPERDEDGSWDPRLVDDHLEQALCDAARLVRRARWLCRLSESVVSWSTGDGRRLLVIEAGVVTRAAHVELDAPLPLPGGARKDRTARQRAFDIATYDRLRVLTTELRAVIAEGAGAVVCLGPRRRLRGARLHDLLQWV